MAVMSIRTIIRTIIGIAILLIILGVITMLYGLFPSGDSKASMNNFESMGEAINSLDVSNKVYDYHSNFPYYISDYFILAGFNKGKVSDPKGGGVVSKDICQKEDATKPKLCGEEYACICLYPETHADNDFDNDGTNLPEDCIPLEGVDYIFTLKYYDLDSGKINYNAPGYIYKNILGGEFYPTPPKNYYSNKYGYLFIYGACSSHGFFNSVGWSSKEYFNTQQLHIEKMKIGDKVYVFIGVAGALTRERTKIDWDNLGKIST